MPLILPEPQVSINDCGPFPGNFKIETEWIDVSTMGPGLKPDLTWQCVDEHGHFHAWNIAHSEDSPSIITADQKFRKVWNEDDQEFIHESRGWFCRICNSKIEGPAWVPDYSTMNQTLPGRKSWLVENIMISASEPKFVNLIKRGNRGAEVSIVLPALKAFGVGQLTVEVERAFDAEFKVMGTSPLGRYS
jgi:hypothetical protein